MLQRVAAPEILVSVSRVVDPIIQAKLELGLEGLTGIAESNIVGLIVLMADRCYEAGNVRSAITDTLATPEHVVLTENVADSLTDVVEPFAEVTRTAPSAGQSDAAAALS